MLVNRVVDQLSSKEELQRVLEVGRASRSGFDGNITDATDEER